MPKLTLPNRPPGLSPYREGETLSSKDWSCRVPEEARMPFSHWATQDLARLKLLSPVSGGTRGENCSARERPPRRLRRPPRPLRPPGPTRPTQPAALPDDTETLWEGDLQDEEDTEEEISPFPSDYVARLLPAAYLKDSTSRISGSPWALVHSPDELAGNNLDTSAILTLLGYPEPVIAAARPRHYVVLVYKLPPDARRVLATWQVVTNLAKSDPAGRFERVPPEDWEVIQTLDWATLAAAALAPGADPVAQRRYRLRVQLKYAFSVHEQFSGQGYTLTTLPDRDGIGVEEWYVATRTLAEIGLYKALYLK